MMMRKQGTGPTVETVPKGDTRSRLVCPDCGYIEYSNPKVVVGAVCTWQDKVLLCRRAIAPASGRWTIPAGFMELGESTSEGAAREVWEEALARVRIEGLVGIYDIPHISQVHVIYRAAMTDAEFAAGEESEEVGLFAWSDVPWDELAFPSVRWALKRYLAGLAPEVHVSDSGARL
jgi:ADP-ribose pyrophosphatase YjhB (NUDIX family)